MRRAPWLALLLTLRLPLAAVEPPDSLLDPVISAEWQAVPLKAVLEQIQAKAGVTVALAATVTELAAATKVTLSVKELKTSAVVAKVAKATQSSVLYDCLEPGYRLRPKAAAAGPDPRPSCVSGPYKFLLSRMRTSQYAAQTWHEGDPQRWRQSQFDLFVDSVDPFAALAVVGIDPELRLVMDGKPVALRLGAPAPSKSATKPVLPPLWCKGSGSGVYDFLADLPDQTPKRLVLQGKLMVVPSITERVFTFEDTTLPKQTQSAHGMEVTLKRVARKDDSMVVDLSVTRPITPVDVKHLTMLLGAPTTAGPGGWLQMEPRRADDPRPQYAWTPTAQLGERSLYIDLTSLARWFRPLVVVQTAKSWLLNDLKATSLSISRTATELTMAIHTTFASGEEPTAVHLGVVVPQGDPSLTPFEIGPVRLPGAPDDAGG